MSGLLSSFRSFQGSTRALLFAEFAERASYYGYRSLLVIFLTSTAILIGHDNFSTEEAAAITRGNIALTYFATVIGGLIADWFFGRYRTLVLFASLCTLGHLCLALAFNYEAFAYVASDGLWLFKLGLFFIAIGAGGLKPCTSGLFGDTLPADKEELMEIGYKAFYLAINVGALISFIFIPIIRAQSGYELAFGIPGLLMLAATITVVLNRQKLPHNPPIGYQPNNWLAMNLRALLLWVQGQKKPWDVLVSRHPHATEKVLTIGRIAWFFAFFILLWAAYDTQGVEFASDANYLDLDFSWGTVPPEAMQTLNTIFVLLMLPISVPLIRWVRQTFQVAFSVPTQVLWAMFFLAIGLFLESIAAFRIQEVLDTMDPTLVSSGVSINTGVSGWWQVASYFFISAGEVLFSVGGLTLGYTMGPPALKATVLSIFYLSTAAGNLLMKFVYGFMAPHQFLHGTERWQVYIALIVALLFNAILFNRYLKKQPNHGTEI